ncbi:hypothetical protein F4859DRAFT_90606 [Xylaria cf. heliscus]|nr:hypothetical protein F4859DRAFT_90606 [Xylaria cf. heliscus]
MPAGVEELEDAVCNIIQIIKQIPELGGTQLKVTGGLAHRYHLDQNRPVDKIEFISILPTSLKFLEVKLLEHAYSPFTVEKQGLFYESPAGRKIQIKIIEQLFWYQVNLPRIHEIGYGVVPYISRQELDRLYPNPCRAGAADVRKRQQDAARGAPALKSRHTMVTRPRQHSDENVTNRSNLLSVAGETAEDGEAVTHRRTRSDSGLFLPWG